MTWTSCQPDHQNHFSCFVETLIKIFSPDSDNPQHRCYRTWFLSHSMKTWNPWQSVQFQTMFAFMWPNFLLIFAHNDLEMPQRPRCTINFSTGVKKNMWLHMNSCSSYSFGHCLKQAGENRRRRTRSTIKRKRLWTICQSAGWSGRRKSLRLCKAMYKVFDEVYFPEQYNTRTDFDMHLSTFMAIHCVTEDGFYSNINLISSSMAKLEYSLMKNSGREFSCIIYCEIPLTLSFMGICELNYLIFIAKHGFV